LLFPNVFAIAEIFEDRKPAKRFRVKAALYQLSYAPKKGWKELSKA